MRSRLIVLLVMGLALGSVACSTAKKASSEGAVTSPRSPAFEAWSLANGTGAFFPAVGPGGGSGVQSAW
jgi:hypothetical protein